MRRLVARHSLPTRILHWLSVPVLATLVWSGVAISGAKAPYTISIGGQTIWTLFPEEFFRTYNMPVPPRAIAWHFTFMWPFVAIGVSYAVWTLFSGSWREIVPRRGGFRAAWQVFIHDLKSKSPARATDGKYNAAQRLAYTSAILILMAIFLTGLAIYRPTQLSFLVWLMGGYPLARAIHFWLTFALLGFVAIHVLQVFRAGWNTFRSMMIGVEVVDEPGQPMSKSEDMSGDEAFRRELRSRTRRGFAASAAALAAGAAGWTAFLKSPREGHINRMMRRAFDFHEAVGRATFRASSRAAEFPASRAEEPVVYGINGMYAPLDAPHWRLTAIGAGGDAEAKIYPLAQILKLPRVEMTSEIRCVEGWSTVVHWSGVRLKDFAAATGLASRTSRPGDVFSRRNDALKYASVATPGGGYYVGLDVESALHSQTLLCDRMNGRPLDEGHGAPLRLVIPTKYGFKSLKRLGEIRFLDTRPADYWAESGYDWYAGL